MATRVLGKQRGFILVTLIFLVLVGVLLMSGMAFLYSTADTQQGLQNGGAQAFVTAESGDQYGVYWLETNYATRPLTASLTTVPAPPVPPSPPGAGTPDCRAHVTIRAVRTGGAYRYTVTSVVSACAGSGAARTVVRTVTGIPPGTKTKVCTVTKKGKKRCRKVKNKSKKMVYTTIAWTEE